MSRKQKKLSEFESLLEELTDVEFLEGVKAEGINAATFAASLRAINENQIYTVIGYGSLMKRTDAKRTLSDIKSFKLGYINGYKRVFNTGRIQSGAYLNVTLDDDAVNMPVAVIKISGADMLMFMYRERMYEIETVAYRIDESERFGPPTGEAYIVRVANKRQLKVDIEPMLSYFSLCIAGAKELMDQDGFMYYLRNTRIANGDSINSWMNNLNLADYYKTHTHTTR